MSAPLDSLKVLDFSTLLPGPFATMILADLGVEVIRVESPTRKDIVREMEPRTGPVSAAHATLNRSKRFLALDLKHPDSLSVIHQLVRKYDIVLEQFRPGVMQRLGLGYEQLSLHNPALIYCSLTGYGQNGPFRARAGHDINYLSISGLSETGRRKDASPVPQAYQTADLAGGSYHAVMAILAAVIHRQQTGEGQAIDLSMTDAVFSMHALEGAGWLAGGEVPKAESQMLNGGTLYDYYQTRDGRWISVGSLEPAFQKELFRVLDITADSGTSDLKDSAAQERLKKKLKNIFIGKDLKEWQSLFAEGDACVEPVLNLAEAVEHPQLKAREMITEIEGGDSLPIKQIASPFRFSKSPAEYRHPGKPVGADTLSILRELEWPESSIREFLESGACGVEE